MTHSLLTTPRTVKRGLTPKLTRLKARLRRYRVSAWDLAMATGVTDAYVWMVLNGRRRSPRILEAAERLLIERRSPKTEKP